MVDKLQNTEEFLNKAFDHICSVRVEDGFEFEKVKIGKLTHPHMDYTGIEVLLLAKLGGQQTYIQIDLGFGDIVELIHIPSEQPPTHFQLHGHVHDKKPRKIISNQLNLCVEVWDYKPVAEKTIISLLEIKHLKMKSVVRHLKAIF